MFIFGIGSFESRHAYGGAVGIDIELEFPGVTREVVCGIETSSERKSRINLS
jgi:hypothetical protein